MIHFISPYTPTKQLADCYNWYANNLPENDWICFVDADAMFLNPFFGQQIEEIIKLHGEKYKAFTCITNRVGNLNQCYARQMSQNFDLLRHIRISNTLAENYKTEVKQLSNEVLMSGVLILAKVKTFREIPFRGDGMLGVDNNFHADCGNIGLMLGVYIFHKYRALNTKDKSHLK